MNFDVGDIVIFDLAGEIPEPEKPTILKFWPAEIVNSSSSSCEEDAVVYTIDLVNGRRRSTYNVKEDELKPWGPDSFCQAYEYGLRETDLWLIQSLELAIWLQYFRKGLVKYGGTEVVNPEDPDTEEWLFFLKDGLWLPGRITYNDSLDDRDSMLVIQPILDQKPSLLSDVYVDSKDTRTWDTGNLIDAIMNAVLKNSYIQRASIMNAIHRKQLDEPMDLDFAFEKVVELKKLQVRGVQPAQVSHGIMHYFPIQPKSD